MKLLSFEQRHSRGGRACPMFGGDSSSSSASTQNTTNTMTDSRSVVGYDSHAVSNALTNSGNTDNSASLLGSFNTDSSTSLSSAFNTTRNDSTNLSSSFNTKNANDYSTGLLGSFNTSNANDYSTGLTSSFNTSNANDNRVNASTNRDSGNATNNGNTLTGNTTSTRTDISTVDNSYWAYSSTTTDAGAVAAGSNLGMVSLKQNSLNFDSLLSVADNLFSMQRKTTDANLAMAGQLSSAAQNSYSDATAQATGNKSLILAALAVVGVVAFMSMSK